MYIAQILMHQSANKKAKAWL